MFERFVQVGRVVLITYGEHTSKIAVIVDVIDHNRVLVQGPQVPRHELSFRRCLLTPVKIDIPRAIGCNALEAVFKKVNVQEMWSKTAWAKKIASREKKRNLSDFDRFKVMIAKKQKKCIIGRAMKNVKA